MTYCFKCRSELPDMTMIYCPDCSLWPNEDEAEQQTVIRDCAPTPATFVAHVATREGPKGKGRFPWAAAAASLLILFGALVLVREELSRPGLEANAQGVPSSISSIQEASAHLVPATIAKLSVPVPRQIVEPPLKRNLAAAIKPRQQPMRTRIEIVDNVERCYAIPGGREIPCV